MEHHGDPSVLRFYEAREGVCSRLHGCIGYELRHSSPTRVSEIVYVAVPTVDVATAGDLDEDGVDRNQCAST